MNTLFLHCRRCIQIPKSDGPQFFITSCGNVMCQKCLTIRNNLCNKCGGNCARQLISNEMRPNVAFVFKNQAPVLKRLRHKLAFQERRIDGYIKYLTGKVTSLENALSENEEKIHALELENSALEKSLGKLNEDNRFLEQQHQQQHQQQQSMPMSKSPVVHNRSTEFADAFFNAISNQQGNDTFDSFTETPHLPQEVQFENNRYSHQTLEQPFQSTPLAGHEQASLSNFGFTPDKPVPSIISNRYYS